MKYLLEEEFKNCSNGSSYLDVDVKLHMVNETLTIASGKVVSSKRIEGPWKAGFYAEMYDRGQWSLMYQRKVDDLCTAMFNPLEM